MVQHKINDLAQYFQPVMQRIADLLGRQPTILSCNKVWVHFAIPGMTDRYAAVKLESRNDRVLPGDELRKFQVLCPHGNNSQSHLWLHYLPAEERPGDFAGGVMFY